MSIPCCTLKVSIGFSFVISEDKRNTKMWNQDTSVTTTRNDVTKSLTRMKAGKVFDQEVKFAALLSWK
jgi:hypothetical protein